MSYITAEDLRFASLAEWASGLALTDDEVETSRLTAKIARMEQEFDNMTNDHFASEAGVTITLQGDGSQRLYLPRRCTAVTSLNIINYAGTPTLQAATVYRLHSSLDAAGAERVSRGALDYIDILPYQFISGASFGLNYGWPDESGSISIVGTFGWTTTPAKVKRAIGIMVYAEVKDQADILGHVTQWSSQGNVYQRSVGPTGVPRIDEIVAEYTYDPTTVMIG